MSKDSPKEEGTLSGHSLEDAMSQAVEKACSLAGGYLGTVLKLYLEKDGKFDFSLAFRDPQAFHKKVSEIFGEAPARLLENLIMETILRGRSSLEDHDFASFVDGMKKSKAKETI